ncbi:MAG: ABC transporter permease [Chloroflexi bacterium]|nr:ABC transporter permease [Chloroflexota bacterium]
MSAFKFLYIATIREFVRDITALFWTLAFPVMFILIFGVIFSDGDDISFDIGLVNEDGAASSELVENLKQIEVFNVKTGNRADELDALKEGDRSLVIVIPQGTGAALDAYFTRLTTEGDNPAQAQLDVYYDPADQNTSQIVLNIVDKVIAGMNEGMTGIKPALITQTQKVTTDDLRNIDYLLPGVLAMSLMQLGLFGTAAPLVSLREKGVLRRMGATPLPKFTMLASQIAFRLTIAFAQTGVIISVGMLLFGVQIEFGNLPAIIGVMILGATLFITMGYFISGLAKTEEAVQGLIALPNFLFMFLSGIWFPVEVMPSWIRPLVDIIPLTYLGDALRATMIDAGSYFSMVTNLGIMLAWLVVCTLLALRFFRWEAQA